MEREKGNQMHIKPFGIEMWMNEFEDHCKYNLAETCVKSMTIEPYFDNQGNEIISRRTFKYETHLWRNNRFKTT